MVYYDNVLVAYYDNAMIVHYNMIKYWCCVNSWNGIATRQIGRIAYCKVHQDLNITDT
jgi:hypothetical protein